MVTIGPDWLLTGNAVKKLRLLRLDLLHSRELKRWLRLEKASGGRFLHASVAHKANVLLLFSSLYVFPSAPLTPHSWHY